MTLSLAEIRALVDTELGDAALQVLVDSAYEAIDQRLDPDNGTATELLTARGDRIMLARPATEITTISEYWFAGSVPRVLAADDYELLPSGQTILRLWTGTTPAYRWLGRVRVDYVTRPASNLRDSVASQLVALDIIPTGVSEVSIGSYSERYDNKKSTYAEQREAILGTLRPEGVLL